MTEHNWVHEDIISLAHDFPIITDDNGWMYMEVSPIEREFHKWQVTLNRVKIYKSMTKAESVAYARYVGKYIAQEKNIKIQVRFKSRKGRYLGDATYPKKADPASSPG